MQCLTEQLSGNLAERLLSPQSAYHQAQGEEGEEQSMYNNKVWSHH